MKKTKILGAVFCLALMSTSAFAESRCNRGKRYAGLSDAVKNDLSNGQIYVEKDTQTGTEFHMAYVYKMIDVDAELLMAAFSKYEEQASFLAPNIKKALIEDPADKSRSKRTRIEYELDTGRWYVPNSHYVVLDTLKKDADGSHLLSWSLVRSWGTGRPTSVDGYMRAETVGNRALMIYCNYATPDVPGVPGMSHDDIVAKINTEGVDMLKTIVNKTEAHVKGINGNQGRANAYRDDYRKLGL